MEVSFENMKYPLCLPIFCCALAPNILFKSKEDPRLCDFVFRGGGVGGTDNSFGSLCGKASTRLSIELLLSAVYDLKDTHIGIESQYQNKWILCWYYASSSQLI